jgi:protocatechuate 3,4-dioxygenase alpha subunit
MTDSASAPTGRTRFEQTPSQTIGPFFAYALPYDGGQDLVPAHHPLAIRLHGTVFDGAGDPVPDALIEIWQANGEGIIPQELGSLARDSQYAIGSAFTGFGRCPTTLAGTYGFTTVKPGPVNGKAPYVFVTVFARGMPIHLFTRVYFPDEVDPNAGDTVLSSIPADRRATLIAIEDKPGEFRFDIHLQGEAETIFLDFDA